MRQEVGDHFVALALHTVGQRALDVDEMVDGGDVDALRELLLVAQERGDVVPRLARHVDDGLAVRVVEHRVGEALEHRRRDFVARGRAAPGSASGCS